MHHLAKELPHLKWHARPGYAFVANCGLLRFTAYRLFRRWHYRVEQKSENGIVPIFDSVNDDPDGSPLDTSAMDSAQAWLQSRALDGRAS